MTYPDGKQVNYRYDDANRLQTVTDWANRVTTYQYDNNGRMEKTFRPNGTVLSVQYNAAGQIIQQKDIDNNGNIINQYDYTYDAVGNVQTEASSIQEQDVNISNANMTYGKDNRLSAFNGQTVTYDADGNMTYGPINDQLGSYNFDTRNRLISAGSIIYSYDAENQRLSIAETVNGIVYSTNFITNHQPALSQVLVKTDPQGRKTFYVYGLGLIGQEEDGIYKTYHFDLRGSTIALTDSDANVTDRVQYGPYGELVYKTGTTSTPFLYNGRDGVMSDNNGLYYMRARYYNHEIKRFINQDVVVGSINDAQTLNRYVFVVGNPVSNIDPSGLTFSEIAKDSQRLFWRSVAELYLKPKNWTVSASLLEHSLQNNPKNLTFLEGDEIVDKVKGSNEFVSKMKEVSKYAEGKNEIYYQDSIAFVAGDLFGAIHRADITVYGTKEEGQWNLWVSINDEYDFTEWLAYNSKSIPSIGNDLAHLSQNIGAIIPYEFSIGFKSKICEK